MKQQDKEIFDKYSDAFFWSQQLNISHGQFENDRGVVLARRQAVEKLSINVLKNDGFNQWLKMECVEKDADGLEWLLNLHEIYHLLDSASIGILSGIACDDWHHSAEDLVCYFEGHSTEETDKILYNMSLCRYPQQYYSDDDNGCVSRKCIWALWRSGSIDWIKKLADSDDKIAAGYAKHQLNKLSELSKVPSLDGLVLSGQEF